MPLVYENIQKLLVELNFPRCWEYFRVTIPLTWCIKSEHELADIYIERLKG